MPVCRSYSAITTQLQKLKPMCAICRKPVEELTILQSNLLDNIILVGSCHGDKDWITLERRQLWEWARDTEQRTFFLVDKK